ncbi:MAG TPA: metallopeptidase TldD-related protein [Terriglobia bacterium]|nr:metallopeptidase TldD-related protein [Terriglobia bacterium]
MKRTTKMQRRRSVFRTTAGAILTCLALALGLVVSGQSQQGTDIVFRAMNDELTRSMSQLQLKELQKPYFAQYVILDEDEYSAEATFGALTSSHRSRNRYGQTQVRIGDYDFDNSEFNPGRGGSPATGALYRTVVDDNYAGLRHDLWLASDAMYKQAIETLSQKRAYLQNKVQEEQPPDFSKEKAVRAIAQRRNLEFDQAKWEAQLREWSRIFREYKDVQTSGVTLRARLTHRYMVNSEGTTTLQPELLVSLETGASVQAPDGMRIGYSIPFHARSFEDLPSPQVFADTIRQLAANLTSVRAAPVLEANYSGPVLLTGAASTEMFARVLAPNLYGQRAPLGTRGSNNVSDLADRMNRPVLPPYFTVIDDPGQKRVGDRFLIGSYEIDDQGVPAKRVALIEDGLLNNMLMSRRPGQDRLQSNGHGRSGYPGRETTQIGNLFVTAKQGKSYDELKKQLINLAKEEKLKYALVIKGVSVSGGGPVGSPVLVYKVHVADGREELIRGASASGLSVSSLRHIQAAGKDAYVANRLTGIQGAETPVSVIAPSVLLEEMELSRPTGAQQKPALMTHPYFNSLEASPSSPSRAVAP